MEDQGLPRGEQTQETIFDVRSRRYYCNISKERPSDETGIQVDYMVTKELSLKNNKFGSD